MARKKGKKPGVNVLPYRARECEDGSLISDINDWKLMTVFESDQGATFYTCHTIEDICYWLSSFIYSFSFFISFGKWSWFP